MIPFVNQSDLLPGGTEGVPSMQQAYCRLGQSCSNHKQKARGFVGWLFYFAALLQSAEQRHRSFKEVRYCSRTLESIHKFRTVSYQPTVCKSACVFKEC